MNPLVYTPVIRALFRAMTVWIVDGESPPDSRYPRLANGSLAAPADAGWPAVPGVRLPAEPLTPVRLDFGPRFARGIVDFEPPRLGEPYVVRVPVVDEAGNDRAGVRLPEIEVPLATHTGWNYRRDEIGSPDRLASEIGSYFPLPRDRAQRESSGDSRLSIEERYRDENDYLGRITVAALALVENRLLLPQDIPRVIERAREHYRWAVAPSRK